MSKRRILAIIISLTLAFSVVGCGKSSNEGSSSTETAKEESSSNSGDEFKKTELNEKNVFELGANQTKEAKTILEKYGIKTRCISDTTSLAPIGISKDENDTGYDSAKGYCIQTSGDIMVNDGGSGEHKYDILYEACEFKNDNELSYMYQITIEYPITDEFKMDNFKMFKELVQSVQGKDYDFASLEKWIDDHMKKLNDGSEIGVLARDVGSYHEGLEGGKIKLGNKDRYLITYMMIIR